MLSAHSKRFTPSQYWWWLVIVVCIGLGLRLWHISYGLPRTLFTDEEFFINPSLQVAEGRWNPGWFNAPASPQIYTTGLMWRIQNAVTNGIACQSFSPAERYSINSTSFVTSARILSALMGALTIILIGILGSEIRAGIGFVAAIMVAGNFYLVEHSHMVRPDIWQTVFLVGASILLWKFWRNPKQHRWLWGFAMVFGGALTQKYTSALFAPIALWVAFQLYQKKSIQVREIVRAFGLLILTVIVSMPSLMFSPIVVAKSAQFEIFQDHGVHSKLGLLGNGKLYIQSFGWQMGTLLSGSSVILILWLALKKRLSAISQYALVICGVYAIGLLCSKHTWDRWMIPVITFATIPIAEALLSIWSYRRFRLSIGFVTVLLFLGPFIRLVRTEVGYTLPPTSEMTRIWLLEHAPVGSTIFRDPYGPSDFSSKSFTLVPLASIGTKLPNEYPAGSYLIANEDIQQNWLTLAQRYGPASSYAVVGGRYATLNTAFERVYQTDVRPGLTPDDVIMANDFNILRSAELAIRRGPKMWVLKVR